MALEITSLRTRYRVTPQGNLWYADVPYIFVNACFKVTDDEHLFLRTKAEADEYHEVLTIDDPERYEKHLLEDNFLTSPAYDGFGRAWSRKDPPFYYIEKFQTFWFRQWIADSTVTRAIIGELEHYKKHGKLPSVYRHAEEYIILSHFHCLDRLWD
jgi:hypothetical protein